MRKLKLFFTVCLMLVTVQAYAMPFNLDLSSVGGHVYSNIDNFGGVDGTTNTVSLTLKNAAWIAGSSTPVTSDDRYFPTILSTFDIAFTVNLGGYSTAAGGTGGFGVTVVSGSSVLKDVLQLSGHLSGHFVDNAGHFVYDAMDSDDSLKLSYKQYDMISNSYNSVNLVLLDAESLLSPSKGAVGNYDDVTGSFSANVILKDVPNGYFETLGGLDFSEIDIMLGVSSGNFLQGGFKTVTSEGPNGYGLYNLLQSNTLTGASVAVATPEPASMILLGSGLLGLFAARRRKNAN